MDKESDSKFLFLGETVDVPSRSYTVEIQFSELEKYQVLLEILLISIVKTRDSSPKPAHLIHRNVDDLRVTLSVP